MSSSTYAQHQLKTAFLVGMVSFSTLKCAIRTHFSEFVVMVRNAGQLPQPFWLGVVCGGGSRSATRCAART